MCDTVVSEQSWTDNNVGVWIDIFPFDGADDCFNSFCDFYHNISKIWRSTYRDRAFKLGELPSNTKRLNFLIRTINFLHANRIIRTIARLKVKHIQKQAQKIGYGTTNYVSQYAFCHPGTKEYYPYSAFEHITEIPFEDTSVFAITGYHDYLSRFYGNYMELPPVEQRIPKQDYLKFYWKSEE